MNNIQDMFQEHNCNNKQDLSSKFSKRKSSSLRKRSCHRQRKGCGVTALNSRSSSGALCVILGDFPDFPEAVSSSVTWIIELSQGLVSKVLRTRPDTQ